MHSDELAKEIAQTTRCMQMQADMIDALHKALVSIAYDKPSQPAVVAKEAIDAYARILGTYKADKTGRAA